MGTNVKKLDAPLFQRIQKTHPDKSVEELVQLTLAEMGEAGGAISETWVRVWETTLAELKLQMTRATFNTWLSDTCLVGVDEECDPIRFLISVKNDYAKDWLDNRLEDTINRTVAAVAERPITIETVVGMPDAQVPPPPPNFPLNGQTQVHAPPPSPPPPTDRDDGDDGDSGRVQYRHIRRPSDPLKGHLQISHYAIRFWRPFLGADLFDLHLIISSYAYEFEVLHKPTPQLKLLARKLGLGDGVNKLKGRKAYGKKQVSAGYPGLLDLLGEHRLCLYWSEGRGRGTKHYFDYLTKSDDLPLLTPAQVEKLTEEDQQEHWEWLQLHTEVDEAEWLRDGRESRIEPLPVVLREEEP